MWTKPKPDPTSEKIEVSSAVIRRARLMERGAEVAWVEGTMGQIGRDVVHHKPGDPLLVSAIMGAEALLAILHEMKRREG